ncbi:GntR family transcriptional regulator [Slackia equolifaciens]|uniref:GntR family transcriptional regulator n=1 Tax=Slackia equolifaciens TaxID=498718 RepID=A0A3N0B336_9ACTN|nr:GntR family transcriptional regulator [Slackia equolifaciens]RNL41525.1 GntR family transcriptional regulator [Slackia equolifaciens]
MFDSLKIDEKSGVPVWVQIRNHIYFLIKSGQAKPGDVLPTVRELAVKLGVNYNTVHKVYQDLEADGLVNSGRGKRTTVAEVKSESIELPSSPVDVVIDELIRVAKESNISKDDLMMRLKERLDGWES